VLGIQLIVRQQLGVASDHCEGDNSEDVSVTSSDFLFENHGVWVKGMRSMLQSLSNDAEQVRHSFRKFLAEDKQTINWSARR
jgi:hypothetical protein